jgi:hypothetical protein
MATIFHGWNRLPNELKLEIIFYHMTFWHRISRENHLDILASHIEPILRTRNRQLTTMALETYYKNNEFTVYMDGDEDYYGVDYPPPKYGPMITRLHILARECDFGLTLEDMLLAKPSGWRYLLTPKRALDTKAYEINIPRSDQSTSLKWQEYFLNLTNLKLNLRSEFLDYSNTKALCDKCNKAPESWEEALGWMRETEMGVKASDVQVEISMYESDELTEEWCVCSGEAERLLVEMGTKK